MADTLLPIFEQIYSTELVYRPNCWQLCGDAHCCNFSRYKAKFRLLAPNAAQELPLLPGEFEFLQAKGWDRQFHDFDRKAIEYEYGNGRVRLESVVSRRVGCACDHATRTTICRLYPLLPIFDVTGEVTGAEPLGIYEEMERIESVEPACRIEAVPFDQLEPFLRISRPLASSPVLLFHVIAYRAAKQHAANRLAAAKATTGKSVFAIFESALLRRRLVDHAVLRPQLAQLHAAFEMRYGRAFSDGMAALHAPTPALGTRVAESVTSASRS